MKKLGSISIGLLLMLLALILLGQVSLPDAAASIQCYTSYTLLNSVDATAAPPRCYHFNVLPNTRYLRIKLEAMGNGKFDLYHSANQVEFLSNWNKVNKGEISGKASYVDLEPRPGTHTIAVARTDGSGGFRLNTKAVGAASSASNQPSISCADGCRTMYTVTTTERGGALELGSDYGDEVIFPLEIGSPGRVEVHVTWSGTASTLALILNGPDRPELPNPEGYYARKDGGSPLTLTYNITADDFRRGRKWWVRLVNFSGGQATGNVEIHYPAESTRDSIEAEARLEDFVGQWQNVDADTGGITKIHIDRVGNSLNVHSWGACVPQDCDHGTNTVAFEGNPVVIGREFSFKRETLTLTLLRNGELRVLSDNVFTDGTNRDYVSEYRFRRLSMEHNTDRPGRDYKSFDLPKASPDFCRAACAQDPRCKAYSYVKPGIQGSKARCWLKSSVPASVRNQCCVSGVVETIQRPDDIRNFRVTRASNNELQFTVDYDYNTDHGNDVWVGAYVLRNGRELVWFGYRPARVNRGSGRATIGLTYAYNNPPASVTTDQVKVVMYVGGESAFYSKTFNYRKTWSAAVERLSAPRQLSPANGAVFHHYPRTTTLRWSAVPGAAKYTVEIDCYHCCQSNKWCTDVGRTHKLVPNVRATTYTFNFVGAQPGRWRVWAMDTADREGRKSGWREFRYTR